MTSDQADYQELRIENFIAWLKQVKTEEGNLPIYVSRRAGYNEQLDACDVSVRKESQSKWPYFDIDPKRVLIGD